MKKILLVCGSGASSGFIAQNMRKAAKAKGLDVTIKAVSDTQIEDYVDEIDLLMIGPHLKHRLAEIEESVKSYKIKAMLIDQQSYASLDGASVLEAALKELD
ncbi:MAG: PTS sugar transporter subunit IIB [Clostridia bacterium BRH_c25]|nr:MAG: PTS sugar transporter subunit IIB [Clostridia bacterium BRH_c25]